MFEAHFGEEAGCPIVSISYHPRVVFLKGVDQSVAQVVQLTLPIDGKKRQLGKRVLLVSYCFMLS